MKLTVKNWAKFQHYGDRCPPWIKLHVQLLNNRAVMGLSLESRGLLTMIWVLASESKDGTWEGELSDLAWRLRCAVTPSDLQALESVGLVKLEGMLAPVSGCSPERESERERESEEKRHAAGAVAPPVKSPRKAPATWLTRYGDGWRKRWGVESEPPWGEMAKEFARAAPRGLGPDELLRRWWRFLQAAQTSQWARPARFVQGLGEWAADRPPPARGQPAGPPGGVLEQSKRVYERMKAAQEAREHGESRGGDGGADQDGRIGIGGAGGEAA